MGLFNKLYVILQPNFMKQVTDAFQVFPDMQ